MNGFSVPVEKKLHCHFFCDKILHQISHMYIGTLVKGTLETFLSIILVNIIV